MADAINMNDLDLSYEVSPASITNILRRYSLRVANTEGKTFEELAEELFFELDIDRVEARANGFDDIDMQKHVAEAELFKLMVEDGVLDLSIEMKG